MVQAIGANSYGSISRVGSTDNGRVIYQVNDPTGQTAGKVTVAEKSSDVFEKAYDDLLKSAPKMQKYAEEFQDPKNQEKARKTNRWAKIIGASGALLAASALTRKMKTFWQACICALSAIAGYFGGLYAGAKLTTPKEAMVFTKALQTISSLDVQPYNE